jgi:hypothetical protein
MDERDETLKVSSRQTDPNWWTERGPAVCKRDNKKMGRASANGGRAGANRVFPRKIQPFIPVPA